MIVDDPFLLLAAQDTTGARPINFTRRSYPYWCIEYVHSGEGFLQIENENYDIGTGDIYILPKGLTHHYGPKINNPWDKLYFVANGPLIKDLFKTYKIENIYHFKNIKEKDPFFKMIEIIKAKKEDMHEKASVQFHELVIALNKSHTSKRVKLNTLTARVKNYLDKNTESKVTLEELEAEFKSTKSHIVRAFKKDFKITPYEYLLNKKIESAKYYLIETELRNKEIANKLNFHDEFHFSKAFKQRTKITPSQFKKQHTN